MSRLRIAINFTWSKDGDGCSAIAAQFGVTLDKFLKWNPLAGEDCLGLWKDTYACVSIIGEEATPVSSTPTKPSSTKPANGISTPTPLQPQIVDNCDNFHFVVKNKDNCQSIATQHGITLDQFISWNPSAGKTCGGLWADAYCCVHTIVFKPTATTPANGITTPTPTQPGRVNSCKKFDFVKENEGCDVVEKRNNVKHADFVKWNTGVGSDCKKMWAKVYVCVSV